MKKHLLVTGASGYVGRHIIQSLIAKGHQISAVSRSGQSGNTAQPYPSLRWLKGDVTDPHFSQQITKSFEHDRQPDAVIHCAGLTRFEKRLEEEVMLTNLQGTQNTFALAQQLGVLDFYHISTAFVAGCHSEKFSEKNLDVGQTFRNPYEQSKYLAEKYLLEHSPSSGMRIHIYRPSIVVGGDVKKTLPSGTVYTYLKALLFLKACVIKDYEKTFRWKSLYGVRRINDKLWKIPLRIEGDPNAMLNLVLIDDLTDQMLEHTEKPPTTSSTYSVLGPVNYKLSDLKEAFCSAAHIEGIEIATYQPFGLLPQNHLEQKFERFTHAYEPYLYSQPQFDMSGQSSHQRINLVDIATDYIDAHDRRVTSNQQTLTDQALETMGIRGSRDYFDHLTQKDIGGGLLKEINFVSAVVGFKVRGDQDVLRVFHFDQGEISELSNQGSEAQCVYEMGEEEFNFIIRGILDPREAFFSGQLQIKGDQAMGLKLGYAFAEYFRNTTEAVLGDLQT